MFKLPEQYRNKEILIQRVILFALGLGMIVLYFSQILQFIGTILGICSPFLIGGFLAFVLWVISSNLHMLATRYLKMPSSKFTAFLCNIAAVLVLVALISIFLFALMPKVLESLRSIMTDLPASIYALYKLALDNTTHMEDIHAWLVHLDFSPAVITRSLEEFMGWLSKDVGSDFMSNVYTAVSSLFSWTFNLFISCTFSIVLLFNKNRVIREGKHLLKAYLPERFYTHVIHVLRLVISTFKSYIGGSCLECLILGSLVAFIGSLLQIPYALLAGLVVAIGALVPMFGALCAALLVMLFLALESPKHALTFIIMFVCIQQVEGNFIYPNVVGKSVGLPAVYVIVAVTLGASLGGILGMIIFIPITSCVYQIIRDDVHDRLQTQKLHTEKEKSTTL